MIVEIIQQFVHKHHNADSKFHKTKAKSHKMSNQCAVTALYPISFHGDVFSSCLISRCVILV